MQGPATIRQAVEAVKSVQVNGLRTGTKLVTRQLTFEDERPTSVLEVRRASNEAAPDEAAAQRNPSGDRCFTCNGFGHRARECANKRRRSPSPFRCYECQGMGHIAAECANRLKRSNSPRPNKPHKQPRSSSSSEEDRREDRSRRERCHHHDRRDFKRDRPRDRPEGRQDSQEF